MKIAFEEHGSGKPIILLHAFPLSRKMWKQNIDSIVEANYRAITPDLRGFGESSNFADINSMEAMAQDVAELMDSLKIEKAVIGGLSMGGYVALDFYRLFPRKVSALVLCDTNSAADSEDKRESRYEMVEKIEEQGSKVLIENMLPNLVSDFTKVNNKNLMTDLEQMFAEADAQALIAALRGMAERESHDEILKSIDVPTILIFGETDSITDLEVASFMQNRIPASNLFIIENAGHYSNLEQPEQFNDVLSKFLCDVQL
jgi:pimeloyl-ACP methyl ester carboxylesterase